MADLCFPLGTSVNYANEDCISHYFLHINTNRLQHGKFGYIVPSLLATIRVLGLSKRGCTAHPTTQRQLIFVFCGALILV